MKSESGQFMPELPDLLHNLEQFYMVSRTDAEGVIFYTNKKFLDISKWTPKRILGKTVWQMFPETEEGVEQAHLIWDTVRKGKTWSGATEKMGRTGESYHVNLIAVPFMDDKGEMISVTFLELDITQDVIMRNQLQQIAFIDFETGLMSRHKLEATVNEMIQEDKHFSFVHIAIDHYYTLKDLHSHDSERELIKSFSNRLKRFFQDNPIARIGISEFAVLTPFGDWYIQGFLEFLEQNPIYIDNNALPISVSGGIVRFPEDQQTYNHLIQAALTATKDVIEHGGGKIVSLTAESHRGLNRRASIDRKMLTALKEQSLQVVYQPQWDVASGQINMYEALVRWEDDELGIVTPEELISVAEENGLIHEIGAFVLRNAAQLAAEWAKSKQDIKISVNSSVREFSNARMPEKVHSILEATGCPSNRIQLEITERFAFQAEEEQSLVGQMNDLKEEGIDFALDDFGTGYGSFRFLQNLPISKIKIDKEFIGSLLTHNKTQQLVEGMIRLGKSLGLYVVAEGVETEEQKDLLISMGVDAIQGYHIGVPVTLEKIAVL
ncbi:GGDEF family sensory box [Bacillus sp. OxB-1]|uniref:sensor domain-containing protein n=1 Tax=Bacillus sp. (strain OxB-1) TaxID=98228 RepID=UPI000581C371|nr:GGDEF domain-containing phosphodiesterase [Bacillus sp. OxB-1]BAQ09807.1 GGDEF family sensory box [Bacillus sp. OxB-1]